MSKYIAAVLTTILMLVMNLGIVAIYCYSVYEAYSLNGARGLFVAIPVLGQLLWAGVKFFSNGFFSTYYYLIYITLGAFVLMSLLSKLLPDESEGL